MAAAEPLVTELSTPSSAVNTVVVSRVRDVSAVIVPVKARFPLEVIAPQPTVPRPLTLPSVSNV